MLTAVLVTGTTALAALVSGCAAPSSGGAVGTSGAGVAAMRPARLMIHPLTRIGVAPGSAQSASSEALAAGGGALICHLQLLDQYGQNTKALGRVRIELYRPSSIRIGTPTAESGGAGSQWGDVTGTESSFPAAVQDRVWELDLTDPAENARRFDDLVTRTYTLPLGEAPVWVLEWARPDATPSGESDPAAPTLRAMFTYTLADGSERTLRDDFRLRR